MQKHLYAALTCIFAFAGSIFSHQIPEQLTADKESNYDAESFRNPTNHLYLGIFVDSSDNSKSDSFLQLRESPKKRVITSLRCDWKPGFSALWSPDGKHVALSYKEIKSGATRTTLYAASTTSLVEISPPASLQIESLLPQSDPAWKLQKYAETTFPDHWIDNSTLEYAVSGVFRDFESGFTDVTYKVVMRLRSDSILETVSENQTKYTKGN